MLILQSGEGREGMLGRQIFPYLTELVFALKVGALENRDHNLYHNEERLFKTLIPSITHTAYSFFKERWFG